MEERLWDYIDGRADAGERAALEALLGADADVRAQYEELLAVHTALQTQGLEEPSLRFSKNVMEAIHVMEAIGAPAAMAYVNKRVIRTIAVFLLSLIGGVLVYTLIQTSLLPDVPGPKITLPRVDIPAISFNPYLSIVFVFVAVVSGFIALDAFLHKKRA